MKELYLNYRLFSGTEEEFLAIEDFYSKEWQFNGKIHREDGPAIIYSDGSEDWYQNGKRHRKDGPAVVFSNGIQEYWENGKRKSSNLSCTVDEYKKEIDRLKEIEIEYNKLKNIFSV